MDALVNCVSKIASPHDQVVVVAPDRQRSECGHSVTQGRPLKIQQVKEHWFSVDGTPVDCVRVGLNHLAKDADVVISGVNQGANLGVDVMVSGTIAAAREASLHLPIAIAISHYRHPGIPKTWDHVPEWTEGILRRIIGGMNNKGRVWNINLPAIDPGTLASGQIPPIAHCGVDMNPHQRTPQIGADGITLQSNFQNRPRDAGSDVDLCFGGAITITELNTNASHHESASG
ncbi:5'-nucleotidase SurE [Rubripirellula obstinata]|uniref:5'-nucleotidase n=2 Tax=Rubripirellula obstinata TaxID=406547 RepID=A0A5B1CRL4_9BACT|nr:5'-nucleotidase SurE [Rubripirellula obstinata]